MKMKLLIKRSSFFLVISILIGACEIAPEKRGWSDQEAMAKALEWQEQHPIYALAPTDWTNGAYYVGVSKAFQSTRDQRYLAALKTMGYRNEWKPCYRTHHADDIAISYSYLFINTTRSDLVDVEPTKVWLDEHLYEPTKWNESNKGIQKTLWWWCDALFMAPPVITYYAKLTGEEEYLEAMHQYYRETYNLQFDQEEKLFARDLRYVWNGDGEDIKEENGEKVFWSRGNGWVIGGLALMLEQMPADFQYRSFYEDLFKTMAAQLKEIQHEDGLWRTSLLSPESYNHGEVSGSGFFTFALSWGINHGLLDDNAYRPVVTKAWKALRECQNEAGMVGWVQNIGDSPKPADKDSWQNYGTGAFLLAGSEILKLQHTN
jgi:unsaturated rhamnogalacturonyl hydrolase